MTPTPPRKKSIKDLLVGDPTAYGDRFRRQRAGMLESPVDKLGRMPRYDPRSPFKPAPGPNRAANYRTRKSLPQNKWRY